MFNSKKFRRGYCACGKPAIYFSRCRGRFVRRTDHPLCQRCWRSECQRLKAGKL